MSVLPHQRGRVFETFKKATTLSTPLVRLIIGLALASTLTVGLLTGFVRLSTAQVSNPNPLGAKVRKPEFVPGEIVVRFRADATPAVSSSKPGMQAAIAVEENYAQLSMRVERLSAGPEAVPGLRLARVAPEQTLLAIEALRKRSDVIYAEPNYIRRKTAVPNDPRYPQMWGLNNAGQPTTSGGNPGKVGYDIHAEPAWNVTTGNRSVVVGVIDSGIDVNHEDLRENIWTNPAEVSGNSLDDDGNGFVDDINGWDFAHNDASVFDYTAPSYPPAATYSGDVDAHGTHVAGTIGATGNNGIGVTGINWQVSLMSLKFLTGQNGEGKSSDLLKALAYAKAMRELWTSSGGTKGANLRVLNNSYGGGGFSQAELDAIRALGAAGVLFVVAAGNEGRNNDMFPTYPSNYISTNLISVAASNGSGTTANFSNVGAASVHMTAPGSYILSTTPRNTYDFFSGTSMSTPHVAGSAALVCAADPNISLHKLRSVLLYTGVETHWQTLSTGRSVDVNGALQAINIPDTTPPGAIGPVSVYNLFPNYGVGFDAPGDDGNTGKVAAYEIRFADTDLTDPAKFDLATPFPGPIPTLPGTRQDVSVRLPWRHPSVFVGVRAVDEVGNAGPISSVQVSVDAGTGDPYIVTKGPATSLSTGGTPLGLVADDEYKQINLPFVFKFYELDGRFIIVSSNGALHLGSPPGNDSSSSVRLLSGHRMIAGLWDDLRTDRRAGDDVYVVRPDDDRIIFRWQAVTFDTPLGHGVSRGEHPVNFEIELQINGTIILRYGDGNQKVFPVAGLGGGWPDPYTIDSHTTNDLFKDLTNADTVTFALRNQPPPATSELRLEMKGGPDPVSTGSDETYDIFVYNSGPNLAPNVVVTDTLPAGLAFISCTTSQGSCNSPAPGSAGTITVNAGALEYSSSFSVRIVARVIAAAGSTISNTASVSSSRFDSWLGNNTVTTTAQVVQVPVFGNVSQISSAEYMNLALKHDGTVWAWGKNPFDPMGTGASGQHRTPMQVNNLSDVTAVSTGGRHALALKADGTVWAWGGNSFGESGANTYSVASPVRVNGLSNIASIYAGGSHSLALGSDGRVWAWGANTLGQLGLGMSDFDPHPDPVVVPGLSGITGISVGNSFSVVVKNDGTVWTWGYNHYGQLGSSGDSRRSPTQVNGVSGIKSVAASWNHVLALKTDGTVISWGGNSFGQTGSNNFVTVNAPPALISGLTGVSALAGGTNFSLALKADGTVWGWGIYGGLGTGDSATPQPNPSIINGITNVTSISAGSGHAVALLNDGTLRTWGNNTEGQLGDGTNFSRTSPVTVSSILVVSQPTLSPPNWESYFPIEVSVETTTAGAIIHYTLNGQDPTESDPTVASGSRVTVTRDLTFKARAFKSGWLPSAIATSTYRIRPPEMTLIGPTFMVSEGNGVAVFTVNRVGDASNPASIEYATSDSAALNDCNVVNGAASSRCDYATSNGRMYFPAGTSFHWIYIPIIDDAYAEGNENLTITLSNPAGANLGAQSTATIVIQDNDSTNGTNPIDEVDFFIRQQYIDFLGREPDPAGLDGWRKVLNNCGTTVAPPCDRIEVSAGFFRSEEFQSRGYYIYRFFSAVGKIPVSEEFYPDFAKVSGFLTAEQLEANKAAYVNEVMARAEFQTKYSSTFSNPTAYVDALLETVGLPNHPGRAGWINTLNANNNTQTRGQVLRQLVESGEVFNKYFNEAFVIMQYFGYLRRTADASYLSWIETMNQTSGDYRTMINGFMNSAEYRRRFGP